MPVARPVRPHHRLVPAARPEAVAPHLPRLPVEPDPRVHGGWVDGGAGGRAQGHGGHGDAVDDDGGVGGGDELLVDAADGEDGAALLGGVVLVMGKWKLITIL